MEAILTRLQPKLKLKWRDLAKQKGVGPMYEHTWALLEPWSTHQEPMGRLLKPI